MSNKLKRKLSFSRSLSENEKEARKELMKFLGEDYSHKQKKIKVVVEPEENDENLFIPIREISLGGRRKRKTRKSRRKSQKMAYR